MITTIKKKKTEEKLYFLAGKNGKKSLVSYKLLL